MHQVERVTSTSQEGEESDIDSWPGDPTSPNDSKDQAFLSSLAVGTMYFCCKELKTGVAGTWVGLPATQR